jgi:hypothetical protein
VNKQIEESFLQTTCEKRHSGFSSMTPKEQKDIKVKMLYDLIDRDKSELIILEENAAKFKSHDRNSTTVFDRNLTQQIQKIQIKEEILAELKKG